MIDELKNYNVEKTKTGDAANAKKRMAKIEKENKDTDGMELAKYISVKKSVAAGGLYAWCQATLKAYDINKDVEPKKLKAKQMKAAKEKGERELAETEASLA